MTHHPSEPEGRLTRRKANLVSAGNLASAGKRMGLDTMVRLGEEFDSSVCPDSVVADAVEAVIGAVYRDGGLEEARRFVIGRVLLPTVEASGGYSGDPKSRLQELLQSKGTTTEPFVVRVYVISSDEVRQQVWSGSARTKSGPLRSPSQRGGLREPHGNAKSRGAEEGQGWANRQSRRNPCTDPC